MAKKKKKKSISLLEEMDKTMNSTHQDLLEEIEAFQIRLNIADQKARKMIKKKKYKKKHPNHTYQDCQKIVRQEVLEDMQGTNFLDRVRSILTDLVPIVTIIARLVASLILSILSIDSVKLYIKPELLEKMNKVYKMCMSVC